MIKTKFKIGDVVLLSNPEGGALNKIWLEDNPLAVGRVYRIDRDNVYPIIIMSRRQKLLVCNEKELTLVNKERSISPSYETLREFSDH